MKILLSDLQAEIGVKEEIVLLAEHFKSEMMDASELTYLGAIMQSIDWNDYDYVVEIGTFTGQTACFMAKVLQSLGRKNPIVSVDPFERAPSEELNAAGSYAEYIENIAKNGVDDICMPLSTLSQYGYRVLTNRVALLVVDGSHIYENVRSDLHLYTPLVRKGGFVFIDDYWDAYPGVCKATDEWLTPNNTFSQIHNSYFVIAKRLADDERVTNRLQKVQEIVSSSRSQFKDKNAAVANPQEIIRDLESQLDAKNLEITGVQEIRNRLGLQLRDKNDKITNLQGEITYLKEVIKQRESSISWRLTQRYGKYFKYNSRFTRILVQILDSFLRIDTKSKK